MMRLSPVSPRHTVRIARPLRDTARVAFHNRANCRCYIQLHERDISCHYHETAIAAQRALLALAVHVKRTQEP